MNRAIVGILSAAVVGVVGDALGEERPHIHEPMEARRVAPLKSRRLAPAHAERPSNREEHVESKPERRHSSDRAKGSGGGKVGGGLDLDFDDE